MNEKNRWSWIITIVSFIIFMFTVSELGDMGTIYEGNIVGVLIVIVVFMTALIYLNMWYSLKTKEDLLDKKKMKDSKANIVK